MGAILILASLAASPIPSKVVMQSKASVDGSALRLGDVADLTALPSSLALRAKGLQLAVLPRGRQSISLTHASLASRARALMPALVAWIPSNQTGRVLIDRNKLDAAEISAFVPGGGTISKGDQVTARLRAGSFEIQRAGYAMQDARPGQSFFMRSRDGEVLRVVCKEEK